MGIKRLHINHVNNLKNLGASISTNGNYGWSIKVCDKSNIRLVYDYLIKHDLPNNSNYYETWGRSIIKQQYLNERSLLLGIETIRFRFRPNVEEGSMVNYSKDITGHVDTYEDTGYFICGEDKFGYIVEEGLYGPIKYNKISNYKKKEKIRLLSL